MDEQSKAKLDEILAKEPAALTDAEKEFLRARRSYLGQGQLDNYAEALQEQTPIEGAPEPENGSSTIDPSIEDSLKKA